MRLLFDSFCPALDPEKTRNDCTVVPRPILHPTQPVFPPARNAHTRTHTLPKTRSLVQLLVRLTFGGPTQFPFLRLVFDQSQRSLLILDSSWRAATITITTNTTPKTNNTTRTELPPLTVAGDALSRVPSIVTLRVAIMVHDCRY